MKTKTCTRCRQTLDVACFWNAKANKDGLQGRCKDCQRAATKEIAGRDPEGAKARNRERMRVWLANPENREKARLASRRYHKENGDVVRDRQRRTAMRRSLVRKKRVFGLTAEQYTDLLAAQNGGCGICKKPPRVHTFNVDHDHKTGRIRGLLCGPCNKGLGAFKDCEAGLLAALNYVRNHANLDVGAKPQLM